MQSVSFDGGTHFPKLAIIMMNYCSMSPFYILKWVGGHLLAEKSRCKMTGVVLHILPTSNLTPYHTKTILKVDTHICCLIIERYVCPSLLFLSALEEMGCSNISYKFKDPSHKLMSNINCGDGRSKRSQKICWKIWKRHISPSKFR